MRAATLLLSAFLITLSSVPVSAQEKKSCRIITGYGTAIGYGETKAKARENAWELCGSKIIDGYLAQRGQIEESQIEDLTVACINKDCE